MYSLLIGTIDVCRYFVRKAKQQVVILSLFCKAVEEEADILTFVESFKHYFLEQMLVVKEEGQSKKCEHMYFCAGD